MCLRGALSIGLFLTAASSALAQQPNSPCAPYLEGIEADSVGGTLASIEMLAVDPSPLLKADESTSIVATPDIHQRVLNGSASARMVFHVKKETSASTSGEDILKGLVQNLVVEISGQKCVVADDIHRDISELSHTILVAFLTNQRLRKPDGSYATMTPDLVQGILKMSDSALIEAIRANLTAPVKNAPVASFNATKTGQPELMDEITNLLNGKASSLEQDDIKPPPIDRIPTPRFRSDISASKAEQIATQPPSSKSTPRPPVADYVDTACWADFENMETEAPNGVIMQTRLDKQKPNFYTTKSTFGGNFISLKVDGASLIKAAEADNPLVWLAGYVKNSEFHFKVLLADNAAEKCREGNEDGSYASKRLNELPREILAFILRPLSGYDQRGSTWWLDKQTLDKIDAMSREDLLEEISRITNVAPSVQVPLITQPRIIQQGYQTKPKFGNVVAKELDLVESFNLTVCNKSNTKANLAFYTKYNNVVSDDSYTVQGWYPVEANKCTDLGGFTPGDFAFYANNEKGREWTGRDLKLCVDTNRFKHIYYEETKCAKSLRRGFSKLKIDSSEYTLNLR